MNRVIVYGSNGALGRSITVFGIDISRNEKVDHNILVDPSMNMQGQGNSIISQIESTVTSEQGKLQVDSIICVSGGWAGGDISSKGLKFFLASSIHP
ncbi:hypothetical protein BB560_001204 [Smittium megazygosporum]|uniref:NAD(P)-binding domain-containing protein n=1 Tax=Smittium megazygosporum TaxID=133381 RepID=A0A2T9ZI90_9FUNG|nr:hypothetical protein BB560_001204 [Smittium megazygosporum]